MKKYRFLLLGVLLFYTIGLTVAQSSIIGVVTDSINNEKMQYCIVQLLKKDTVSQSTISDSKGIFKFQNVLNGEYDIRIDYIGFKPFSKHISIETRNSALDLKIIELIPSTKLLKTVYIEGDIKKYKKILNVTEVRFSKEDKKKYPKLLQALNNISGVIVDVQHNDIRILGKENVLILVNGVNKPVSEISMLRTIDIDHVEVIKNPGAQYESTYVSVINIITKKNSLIGFGLDTELNAYLPSIYNYENIKLQYGFKKVKLYSYYSLWVRRSKEDVFNYLKNKDDNEIIETFDTIKDFEKRLQLEHNFAFGVDLFLTKKDFVNIYANYKIYKQDIPKIKNISIYKNNNLQNHAIWRNNELENKESKNASLYYKHDFNSNSNVYGVINLYNANLDFILDNILKGETKEKTINDVFNRKKRSIAYKLSYKNLIAKKYQLNIGTYGYYREIETSMEHDNIFTTSSSFKELRTNYFINAVTSISNTPISGGIALEYKKNIINGIEKTNINLLPSFNLQKQIDENNIMLVSFASKLKYPATEQLSNYLYTSDSIHFYKGNPNVKSFKLNSLIIGYSYNKNSFYFNTSISYGYINKPIQPFASYSTDNLVTYSYDNLGSINKLELDVDATFKLGKLSLNPSFSISYNKFDSPIGDWHGIDYSLNISPNYTFKNKINAGIDFYYDGKETILQGYNKSAPSLSFNINRSFLKNKLNIKIELNPFNTYNETVLNFNETIIKEKTIEHYRNIYMNILYYFRHGKKLKYKRKHLSTDSDF